MALTDTKLAEASRRDEDPAAILPAVPSRRAVDRAVMVQFLQFCLVGAVSTGVNVVLLNFFMARGLGVNWSCVLSFSFAVTNGFFLNRAWTFRRSRTEKMERQYTMFFAVNIVGLGLTWVVTRIVGAWLLHTGWAQSLAPLVQQITHQPAPPDHLAYSLGVLASTPPCAIWNFTANKLWTFGGSGDQA